MSSRHPTALGAVARGLLAGAVGTAAMTAWQELSSRLQSPGSEEGDGGGEPPQDPWEQASAPAQVARRVIEGVFQRDAPPESIPALTHGMHWGYGTGWGAVYGLVQGSRRTGSVGTGLAFGTGVWVMSYVQLVPMGLYELPSKYAPRELAMELSYHLVYGAGLGAAYAALDRR